MRTKITAVLSVILFLVLTQCKKTNPTPGTQTDQELYDKVINGTGFMYYKNDSAIHQSSTFTGHKAFFRVKFNATAYAALTDSGRLPVGGSFPEGSLIVKELHEDSTGSGVAGFAVIEKSSDDPNAVDGLLWAEYFGSADNAISLTSKGTSCVLSGCHDNGSNRDYALVFDLFP